ncbi:oxygen-regulated protein 1 [Channa argus]|uniref:oxygen-regulated protein 1 n=1 Tax=Channa argus TaxID=215402 RepID=UPI00352234CF
MSNTPIQEQPAQRLSSDSGQTLPSRPLQPFSDPSASKRVCFYKSGDYKFSGHRMVINARTFKTFDALLDALSKKVPLPFGVRTITTPHGTHLVKGLDDLHDGGSYVCSDQKRVKPLNLDEVHRRQVPWNTTRPLSAGRRQRRQGLQFGRRNEVNNRSAKITERVALRTPKRLEVIKNKDPTVKRTIVLQRRTAPTFDALLDYLSQILQFPVLKLYSTEGRRVDGLASLILCSGVVVAAGNEPFRLGHYGLYRSGQMAQAMETLEQPQAPNNKSFQSGRGSRNFSLSSERYIVNQINRSRNGSTNSHLHHHNGSYETEVNPHCTSTGKFDAEHPTSIVPQDDDIEKSFRVNQDGSMTVEMKVRLTIKEEEMLHWTTTLSRSGLSKRTVCASIFESGNSSPNSNNAKDSSIGEGETKEENHPSGGGKGVSFNEEQAYEGYTSTDIGKAKTSFIHTPTPGPRYVKKKASVESVKTVTESGVEENTLGHYSYMERTADGESAEGYCVVRHNSSSNRPVPKPRKTPSAGATNKGSRSFTKSSGVAEILQIQNNGMEVTETVMHIYESQGCFDNYLANEEYSTDDVPLHGSPPVPDSKPSTESGPRSSSNDIDFSWKPPTADSLQRQKEEMLSLSSEPVSSAQNIMNNLSSVNEKEDQIATMKMKKAQTPKTEKNKKMVKPAKNQKSSTSTSSSNKKQKKSIVSPSKKSRNSSTDKHSSNASMGKQSLSSSQSAKNDKRSTGAEQRAENVQSKSKKSIKKENIPKKDSALLVSTENVKKTPPMRQSINNVAARKNGHNVNTPTGRPQMKKNMSDILQSKKSLSPGKKTITKPRSMSGTRTPSPKQTLELNESVSMPSLNPTPSEVHQYVENWLKKVSPDQVPYTEESLKDESEPHTMVAFQIGGDSDIEENNKCQTNLDEYYTQPRDAVKKSASCLSVPLCHGGPATSLLQNDQLTRGLCVSMPSVRVDPVHQENRLRTHQSAAAIDGPADNKSSSSNLLSPKAKITPVLRQLCSSIQCIRRVSETHTTSNLEKCNSLPDFSTQVALVFGSSCKAFLSFLSVMTLRDSLMGSASGDTLHSRSTSEAMLMMESLQKISVVENEEEQRASLTELQIRASSQFRERWKDFLILRERLESEPLSPRVSETEFALDVVSEGGDVFEDQQMGLDELMEELNMPEDLRAEISSTIQNAKTFYPVEESTFVETDKNQSDSEDEVEQFVKECNDERKMSPDFNNACIVDHITEKKHSKNNVERDDSEEGNTTRELRKAGLDVKDSQVLQAEIDEPLSHKENETKEKEEQVGEDKKGRKDEEDEDTKETNDKGDEEEFDNTDKQRERQTPEEAVKEDDEEQDKWEAENGSGMESVEKVEEGTEEEITVDELEEEGGEKFEGEEEVVEKTNERITDEKDRETCQGNSFEETDEREFAGETEEEETGEEGVNEEMHNEDTEEEVDEVNEKEAVGNIEEQDEEEEEEQGDDAQMAKDSFEQEVEEAVEETDEGQEAENTEDEEEKEEKEEEEEEVVTENSVEEEGGEIIEETDREEEVQNIIDELAEKEEVDVVTEEDVEEADEVVEEKDEEEELENRIEEVDGERDEEIDDTVERNTEAETEVVIEENEEEEEGDDVETENTEEEIERVITDEEEEKGTEMYEDIEQEDKCNESEESMKESEKENSLEKESVEVRDEVEDIEFEESTKRWQVEREIEDDEENDSYEQFEQDEQGSNDEIKEANVSEDVDCSTEVKDHKNLLDKVSYLQRHSGGSEQDNAGRNSESPSKYSSDVQCEDDKGNGTDTVNELEADEGEGHQEERPSSRPHRVEISQELLDFVNSALQSSSLTFTYDSRGNIRIEPDNARVVQTKHIIIPKSSDDSLYGLNCLPSPSTSDLSDYRPETSESGGYKTQESVDIVSESGEEASEKPFPVCRRKTGVPNGRTNMEHAKPELSVVSNLDLLESSSVKSAENSYDSVSQVSREDLSYFSAASSLKADAEAAPEAARCISFNSEKDSADGVLIDQGRWLLRENHLIRKSPPVSQGMYGNADSTSIDIGQENTSEDSPPHHKTQQNPLAIISSSELEEMAKPKTPKCTYYNIPHGSDSDPFLEDSSIKSGKKDTSGVKGRGSRVSPTIDTSKTWTNKNGSLSSFASVEFKIPDRKVHPVGESSAVRQARGTSSAGASVLQAQGSVDTLQVRCSQYCPIL